MAFSFANVAAGLDTNSGGAGGVQVHDGTELQEIQTDQLGFKGINGDTKLRILEKPWSSDALPIPSASLLSVASSQGLLAAAGPDALAVFTTESVRERLREKSDDSIRALRPITTIDHSRLAHVTFSADESVLVVSEESGGGIIAYQASQFKDGKATPALRIETNNTGLRALVPNPAISSAQFLAAVTINGELLLADLANASLVHGSDGVVLTRNVSCVAWSNKGKQLVAGLADGTALQLKPDGTVVAQIPKSTSVSSDVHISNVCWLENDSFLIIYTPNNTSTEDGIPPSEYYIVTREKLNFNFRKLPEILPAFGVERVPTHHLMTRLRSWKPHIDDMIVLAATTATDIGIVSKADKALSSADLVVGAFTFTGIDDDRRRAALPLSTEESLDTTPIGMALDLSSSEKVPSPILGDDEILESTGPLPNLMILNNEGILCSWWLIYNDSVYEKATFSGFANLSTMNEARSAISEQMDSASTPAQPSMTSSEAVSLAGSPFAQPSSTFGSTSQSGFGSGSGFMTKSSISENKGSWASTGFGGNTPSSASGSAFGKPAFGQATFGESSAFGSNSTPAFGSTGTLGARPGGFGQTPAAAPAFGQTGFGAKPATGNAFGSASASTSSPFAAAGNNSGTSGFGSFSSKGGFGGFGGAKTESQSSPFAQVSGSNVLGQNSKTESPFAKASTSTAFGQSSGTSPFAKSGAFGTSTMETSKPAFGAGGPFKLDSTFRGDESAKDDLPKPTGGPGFGFDSGFSNMLGESKPVLSPTRNTEAEMDEKDDDVSTSVEDGEIRESNGFSPTKKESAQSLVTPPSTISQSKAAPTPTVSTLFGQGPPPTTTPQTLTSGNSWSFAKPMSTTPKDTPAPSTSVFGTKSIFDSTPAAVQQSEPVNAFGAIMTSQVTPSKTKGDDDENPRITTESPSDNETVNITKQPEPSLPPVATSKPGYQTGDTSATSNESSKNDDAPLPPDFLPANKSAASDVADAELPQDQSDEGFSSDFEGSGEDITDEISPDEEREEREDEEEGEGDDDNDTTTEPVPASPESSFKEENTSTSLTSPSDGLFTKSPLNQQSKPNRPLFGEVGASVPMFPPPKPQESPRSPSPVRNLLQHDLLRPDSLRPDTRSVSAPARPRSAIDQRKNEYSQSAIAAQAARMREEEVAKERTRLEAVKRTQDEEKAKQVESLEDSEDIRIQRELAEPVAPSEKLDPFITYQATSQAQTNKADIPAQIERLYQDINSMIYTLGINARSLSSFLMHQKGQEPNNSWPAVLLSETPLDALNDEWFLEDVERLHDGCASIEHSLTSMSVHHVQQKLERCHGLLTQDISDLRTKTIAMRKSLHARTHGNSATAPLSAEQASIQHDLRKTSASVQTKLVKVEDELSVLRSRLLEAATTETSNKRQSTIGSSPQKKPTVEAVTNTVAKMTAMAEKKSADVDVLELHLRKLGLTDGANGELERSQGPTTPRRSRKVDTQATPSSAASTVYLTPTSGFRSSTRGTPMTNGSSRKASAKFVVSIEDRDKWEARNVKKSSVASALRAVLEEKRNKAAASS